MSQFKKSQNRLGVKSHNLLPHLDPALNKAYKDWYATLTPEQLKELGGKPHPSNLTGEINPIFRNATTPDSWDEFSNHNSGPTANLGRLFFRCLSHYDAEPVEPSDLAKAPPNHLHVIVVLELMRKVLTVYSSAPDVSTRLHGDIVALALGFPGMTVGSVARKYSITRQAASKRLRNVIKAVGLPPTQRMISQASNPTLDILTKVGCPMPLIRPKKRKSRKSPLNNDKQGDVMGAVTPIKRQKTPLNRVKGVKRGVRNLLAPPPLRGGSHKPK